MCRYHPAIILSVRASRAGVCSEWIAEKAEVRDVALSSQAGMTTFYVARDATEAQGLVKVMEGGGVVEVRVTRFIRRVRRIPPRRLARIIVRKATSRLNGYRFRALLAIQGPHLSEKALARALGERRATDASLLCRLKAGTLGSALLRVAEQGPFELGDSRALGVRDLLVRADCALRRRFDLLGSGWVSLAPLSAEGGARPGQISGKSGLPWHSDFKSGHTWDPRTFYKDIHYGHVPGVDVKVPWELSRCHHLVTLGQAYTLFCAGSELAYSPVADPEGGSSARLTPAGCAAEFVAQVEDWIESNPPMLGVNWACTMDVAIRVCNWLVAWQLFQGADAITDTFAYKFYRSLLEHGRFIRANLEYSETLTSNHYLSNIVGLLYLGVLAPQFKEAEKWRDFARRELVREMEKQVYPDGFDFEASTCYHRLVLELFFYSALLCRRNGIELPQAFWDRLYKMFEVVLYILKPNGRLPQLGDNDSGRLHILYPREVLDGTYLLSYAAIFFEDSNFKLPQFDLAPEAVWVFGREGVEKWQALPPRSEPPGSKAFPDAGVYVMRHNDDYMLIPCGPNGQNGLGGHAHNDKLSFELCIGGEEVIVDPGTYVYTPYPEWRNRFRSTAYHNTVVVDGQEQNPIGEDEVFRLPDLTRCRCLVWETGPEKDVFVGEHYGYLRLEPPVVHRRTVEFFKRERIWVIRDYFYQPDSGQAPSGGSRRSRFLFRPFRGGGRKGRSGLGCTGGLGTSYEGDAGVPAGGSPYLGGAVLADAPAPAPAGAVSRPRALELNLHLAPGVQAIRDERGAARKGRPAGEAISTEAERQKAEARYGQPDLAFYVALDGRPLARLEAWGWEDMELVGGWYSPEYGRKEEALVVRLAARASAPVELRLMISGGLPAKAGATTPPGWVLR